MKHELKRLYSGSDHDRTIQPTCSCGWIGVGYPAWNDYQYAMVKDQEENHIREAHRQEIAEK